MRARFDIAMRSALVVAMGVTAAPVVADDARNCIPSEASADTLSPTGAAMRISLLDFLVIQRALMTMQDERAAPVLDRLRAQLSEQPKLQGAPDH
jgi:hypothetical protein